MRIAVWSTGHNIADTVARSVLEGIDGRNLNTSTFSKEILREYDLHIGYGILRGTGEVFKGCEVLGIPYIHIDRGFTDASHFDGQYRIALNGTQQVGCWLDGECKIPLKPWRGLDDTKPILVIPPTQQVAEHFGLSVWPHPNGEVRVKGTETPIAYEDYNFVYTFNSSVGWQAIAAGIPCVSDIHRSMVGSFFSTRCSNFSLANLSEAQYLDREKMFGCMGAMQLTLREMREGALWGKIAALRSLSATMAAKQSHQMSVNTP